MIYEIYAGKSSEVEYGCWQECKQCKTLFEAFYVMQQLQEEGYDMIEMRFEDKGE